jgi:hypothetical protein
MDWVRLVCSILKTLKGGGWRILPLFIALGLSLGFVHQEAFGAPAASQAGIVVQYGNGSVSTECISFSGSINGLQALQQAGFSPEVAYDPVQGAAVCKIGDDGCPAEDCFCAMPDYWSYWRMGSGGNWNYSGTGASGSKVENGDVEGWSWGAGEPPPDFSFEEICTPPPPTPAPTNTPAPVTETPPPSDTPVPPSDTPVPPTDEPDPTDTPIPPTNTLPPILLPSVTTTATGSPPPSETFVPTDTQNSLQATSTNIQVSTPTELPDVTSSPTTPPPTITPTTVPKTASPQPTDVASKGDGANVSDQSSYLIFGGLVLGLGLVAILMYRKRG